MSRNRSRLARTSGVAAMSLALGGLWLSSAHAGSPRQHVLLISVDGLHQSDLAWWTATHPRSALAALVDHGTQFTNAKTPFPSDSFPGMVGQVTGGDPRTTGIYYDVSYNHGLLDPSASSSATPSAADCTAAPGANVAYDESADLDTSRLDAGQGLPSLPGDILDMTGQPQALINPTTLPIDPATCTRVYPHQYLKVNTVFEVARAHGLRTAWSDKHPAYEILNGPSGAGVQDLFTPEINSDANSAGDDWTKVNSLTQQYDGYKVQAVLNEIAGKDHSGRTTVGMPAILGMNFQSVSTAEKLPTSDGKAGGYNSDGTPGPVLTSALQFVDAALGRMVMALHENDEFGQTTIILSAKHGQSPIDGASLTRIADGKILDQLNAAWASAHPEAAQPLVAAASDDDGMLVWFTNGDRTATADSFATSFLQAYDGNGTGSDGHAKATNINKAAKAYTSAGLSHIYAGPDAASFMGAPAGDERVPDLIGIAQHGVVFTGKTGKIAEHGGDDPQDRDVPLVVSGPDVRHGTSNAAVETTQIAPTILQILGLDPSQLQAVQQQGTAVLPLP